MLKVGVFDTRAHSEYLHRCDHLSMLRLKLICGSKRGHGCVTNLLKCVKMLKDKALMC